MPLDINRLNGPLDDKQVKRNDHNAVQSSKTTANQTQVGTPPPPVKADSVSLTDQAQQLNQVQQQLVKQPSVNQDRVANVRKAIEEGQYKVDPERLAKKLLEFEDSLSDIFESGK